jgi:hypothetical protein
MTERLPTAGLRIGVRREVRARRGYDRQKTASEPPPAPLA